MSTWLYLECTDHDPPIRADDESGQHLYDLPRIRAEVAETGIDWHAEHDRLRTRYHDPGVHMDDPERVHTYFRGNTAGFLRHHHGCNLSIIDEYGDEYPVEDE